MNSTTAVMACIAVVLLPGCSGAVVLEPYPEWESLSATSLPALAASADCEPDPPPSGCSWGLAADAIVWGTMIDVDLLKGPSVIATGAGQLVSECEGTINPGLVLHIEIERTIRGDVAGTIVAHLGARHVNLFNPWPAVGEEGELVWRESPGTLGGQLQHGDMIGVALRYVDEHDVWSVMGQPLFGVEVSEDGERHVTFQRFEGAPGCVETPPADLAGITLVDLEAKLASCSPADQAAAEVRRTQVWNTWGPGGQAPNAYMASTCFPSDE